MSEAVLKTGVQCFLCGDTVPFNGDNRRCLMTHLEENHKALIGMDFLVTGCVMSTEERNAVMKVVENRKPRLIQLNSSGLQVGDDNELKEKPVCPPEVTDKVVTKEMEVNNCETDEEEDGGVTPPRASQPRRFTCLDCKISFKLQIQLNRHKKHCIKKEPGSSISSLSKQPAFVPLSPGSIKTEPESERRHSLPSHTSDLLAQHPGLQLKRTSLPNKPLTDPGSPVLKPSLSLKPTSSLLAQPSPSKTKVTKAVRRLHLFKKGSNWVAPSPGKGFSCPKCGKEFVSKAKMNNHFVDIHQPGEFPCPGIQCGKVFTSKNKQTSHYSKNCSPNTVLGRAGLTKRGVVVPAIHA